MPNFHNVKAASATSVETASELFRLYWGMYRKILKDDYMSHTFPYATLRDALNAHMFRPFKFVDLAAGTPMRRWLRNYPSPDHLRISADARFHER